MMVKAQKKNRYLNAKPKLAKHVKASELSLFNGSFYSCIVMSTQWK